MIAATPEIKEVLKEVIQSRKAGGGGPSAGGRGGAAHKDSVRGLEERLEQADHRMEFLEKQLQAANALIKDLRKEISTLQQQAAGAAAGPRTGATEEDGGRGKARQSPAPPRGRSSGGASGHVNNGGHINYGGHTGRHGGCITGGHDGHLEVNQPSRWSWRDE